MSLFTKASIFSLLGEVLYGLIILAVAAVIVLAICRLTIGKNPRKIKGLDFWLKDYLISFLAGLTASIVIVISTPNTRLDPFSIFIWGLVYFFIIGAVLASFFHRNINKFQTNQLKRKE
ncbi:MAG TPA: hypothetical protein VJH37_03845 [Candidatus Nanoarchaeia archaeon]|nr:hypothetical protein [Candidatus Nanoarchaeia archaeon]